MTRLKQARRERGWTKAQLVHALVTAGRARNISLPQAASIHRRIAYWENEGKNPGAPYAELLQIVYAKNAEQLGIVAAPHMVQSALGLAYASSLETAVLGLDMVARYDDMGHTAVIQGGFRPEAANAASLDWLFGTPLDDLARRPGQVTTHDIVKIRTTVETLDGLDHRFGGDYSRSLAVRFLRRTVVPILRMRCTDKVRRDLFAATAVLCELIGWMAYDTGRHALAQRYFTQALRLADAAGDRAYGAFVLTSMSHQALYVAAPRDALRLARAAGEASARLDVPALSAEASVLIANAHAELGEERQCGKALREAEHHLNRIRPEATPSWATMTEGVFASGAGTSWVALNRPKLALPYLKIAHAASAGRPRRVIYSMVKLAEIARLGREFDRACSLGIAAAEAAAQIQSRRSTDAVVRLRDAIASQTQGATVRDLDERVRLLLTDRSGGVP